MMTNSRIFEKVKKNLDLLCYAALQVKASFTLIGSTISGKDKCHDIDLAVWIHDKTEISKLPQIINEWADKLEILKFIWISPDSIITPFLQSSKIKNILHIVLVSEISSTTKIASAIKDGSNKLDENQLAIDILRLAILRQANELPNQLKIALSEEMRRQFFRWEKSITNKFLRLELEKMVCQNEH